MKRMIFIMLAMLFAFSGFSQEIKSYVISSSGASIMGESGALYLSIGEPMNTEISDGDIMISQGFLQVSISESTSTEHLLAEEIKVFPNPTGAYLMIEMPEMDGTYFFQLYNTLGEEIQLDKITTVRTKVDFSSFSSGTYFLKVVKGIESSKTLKIIKL